jgi:hypothetical protein
MVRMVIEIIKDMKYFLLLVACMAVGFGIAFFLLFEGKMVSSSPCKKYQHLVVFASYGSGWT